jgi:hypothetical protein
MGCGCNENGPAVPLTSGDIAEGRFLVRLADGTIENFESYADAHEYKKAYGGSLDVRR